MSPLVASLLALALSVGLSRSTTHNVLSLVPSKVSCIETSYVTYYDLWGSIFSEKAYTCEFPPSSPPNTDNDEEPQEPLVAPAPYSHAAGQHGADPAIASRGTVESLLTSYHRQLLQAEQKITIPIYGCSLFPSPQRLPEDKFSTLFWGMRQLTNQSCLNVGEAKEFAEMYEEDWAMDWRFVVTNRGRERRCEWWQEIANVAEALHYVCYFSELGTGTGGIEALAWGAEKEGLRWCLRYSDRGWGEGFWEEKCLGV